MFQGSLPLVAAVDDPALVRCHLERSRARQLPTSSLLAVTSTEDIWDNKAHSPTPRLSASPAKAYPVSGG
uniref:Uncharacterized protein n=1 Tax=Oryza sativa subsp. japonica TaxID=39947 RepID=Q6Z8J3_ORYSJ|nr:hypothetical protein [Oryza sativa Japonica Group]